MRRGMHDTTVVVNKDKMAHVKLVESLRKREGIKEEKVNLGGMDPEEEQSSNAPETPLADPKHFQTD